MSDTNDRPEPNYLAAIAAALIDRPLEPGSVTEVRVFHDDWCAVFVGGVCDCNPDIRLITIDHRQEGEHRE